jgi:hypothetical protein
VAARVAIAIAALAVSAGMCSAAQETAALPPKAHKPAVVRGTVTGTVYCSDTNAPARLAQVSLIPVSGSPDPSMSWQTTVETDLDGRFAIGRVPEGTYYVSVDLDGYLNPVPREDRRLAEKTAEGAAPRKDDPAPAVVVSSRQVAAIAITLERAGEIDGTVLYDDGSPAIGLHVSFQPKPDKPAKDAMATMGATSEETGSIFLGTDDHGHFRILGVAPGEYLVNVEVPASSGNHPEANQLVRQVAQSAIGSSLPVFFGDTTRASKAKAVKVGRGELVSGVDITIPLDKLHTVRGTVLLKSNGAPPTSAAVVLLYADTREMARAALAVDGEFEFAYLPEDDYILQASASSASVPGDLDEISGFLMSGSGFEAPDPMNPGEGAEMRLPVRGDVDGLTISVPDPLAEPAPAAAAGQQPPGSAPQ